MKKKISRNSRYIINRLKTKNEKQKEKIITIELNGIKILLNEQQIKV